MIQVVRNRAIKGDQARDSNNFILARKQYITAYEKVQKIRTDCLPYYLSIPKDLILDILSKITTISLELHDYESTRHWADTLRCVETCFLERFTDVAYTDQLAYAKEAFYTAYYSKAVVYQKQGKINSAIENFENALICDGGCAATYYQLEALKRRRELRDSLRKAEEERVHQQRALIKKMAEKKARQRKAKHGRRREKRARGQGYVPGVGSS